VILRQTLERIRRSDASSCKCVRKLDVQAVFAQVSGIMCEVCKTVGSAYVGSNPTPATTSENGPLVR
jgi:hypothetical protein